MSRIGRMPVKLVEGVAVSISPSNTVEVVGPKGVLRCVVDPDIKVVLEDQQMLVTRPTDQKRHKALHGLYRALLQNMVVGVSSGYRKVLELVGVGYRASSENSLLKLEVGYAHEVCMLMPEGISVKAEMVKGRPASVSLEGADKQLVGQVAAKIRAIRKPEPYKGKGIRLRGEEVRRKAVKGGKK